MELLAAKVNGGAGAPRPERDELGHGGLGGEDELALAEALSRAGLELAVAGEALGERERRLHEDLEEALLFQQRVLVAEMPTSPAVLFQAVSRPRDRVGGDIYDVHEITPRLFRLFIGDT